MRVALYNINAFVYFIINFIAKLTFIGDYLIFLLNEALLIMTTKRISPFLVVLKLNNKVYMAPSITRLIEYRGLNYNKKLIYPMLKEDVNLIFDNIAKYKGVTFKTDVNSVIFGLIQKKLDLYQSQEKLTYIINHKFRAIQPSAKLSMMGNVYFYKKLFSKKLFQFLKIIFRIEEINSVTIKVL